ncbi:hypothetical protein [Acidiphilium sp.]|uniref:hypothetical protein n=1 Tax=Acidiphilium sp. TaxID=527 RepID=UPI00258B8481|nr:hypothetical protein [Acidiphilium sp.]
MLDLFGHNVTPPEILARKQRNRAKGYPRPPGSGPKGARCKECQHIRRKNGGAKDYFKCVLLQHAWNHSNTTDIRANSPACSLFEASGAIRIEDHHG